MLKYLGATRFPKGYVARRNKNGNRKKNTTPKDRSQKLHT
jgi:hypothetical protein